MKKLAVAIMMVCMLVFASSAMATFWCPECTWNMTDNANPDFLVTGSTPYSRTFNLSDVGFVVGIDQAWGGYLTVYTKDDQTGDGHEAATINIDGWNDGLNIGNDQFSISWWVLTDGQLAVSILATRGDFLYDKMDLSVYGYDCSPNAVPEPATMLLLGLGLAGVAVARKRFTK